MVAPEPVYLMSWMSQSLREDVNKIKGPLVETGAGVSPVANFLKKFVSELEKPLNIIIFLTPPKNCPLRGSGREKS